MCAKLFLLLITGLLFFYIPTITGFKHNTNTDFLLHEGGIPSVPKSSQTASTKEPQKHGQQNNNQPSYESQFPALTNRQTNNGKTPMPKDNHDKKYEEQFPALGGHTTKLSTPQISQSTAATVKPSSSNGKRDYVAPQFTTPKSKVTQNNDDRKFNEQFPPLGQTTKTSQPTTATNKPSTVSGKRDYVAPQFSTTKPSTARVGSEKVKDLVSFFEKQGTTPKSTFMSSKPFSAVVAGQSKKDTASSAINSVTTPTVPTRRFTNKVNTQTTKSGSQTVLPSSLNNKNKNEGGTVTDLELQTLSEELLRKDVNNAAKYVTINYQGKTSGSSQDDKAPLPLLTVQPAVWNIPTIQKFVPLLDNYDRDTTINEYVTPQERNEENAFMDAIMATSVIRHLMTFLKDKGYVTPDPRQQRDFLKQLWFSLYARNRGKLGSSGFEHVFVSELKNGEISGLHNWIYFSKEETANRANYLGYLKHVDFDEKGAVLKLHFSQQGVDKPVNSLFIGTSPEMEIAVYTLCFLTRADKDCKLKLGNKEVNVVTHTFRYRSKNLIGSAYPQI